MAQATVSVTFPQDYTNVRLVYSTASDLSNPSYSGVNATTNKTAKITVTGLNSLTTYYYGVEVNGTLQTAGRGQFKTFPTSGSATNFTCAFASCSDSYSNSTIFNTIKSYNPAFFIHMGDFHYDNISTNDINLYRNAYNNVLAQPNRASFHANVPTIYMWDDHDFGNDVTANGDGNNKNFVGLSAAHAAYRERVPHYTLAGNAQEPIYQTFVYGRIRFIILDIHTAKDRYTDADSSAKTMLGATQKAWLKNQLIQPEPVKVIVNGQPWIDTANDDDNWTYYATERKEIMDYIKTNNLMDKVMMFSGDMHAIAIDDGTNNTFATGGGKGFPVFQAAPLDQNPTSKGGPYLYGPYQNNGQFGLMSVTDNGSTISVQWTGKQGTTDMASLSLSFSGAAYSQPVPDTTPPNEVTNLASSSVTSTGATITWTASTSTDVANYLVYNGAALLATLASTATSYNLTGLSTSTAYTITVKGKDNAGNISTGANVTFTTAAAADTTPPNEVTNLAVSNNNTGTSLTLSWTASTSSDIASYDVYNGATFLANVTATTYGVTGLTRGTSYTFYVKAKDTSGNVSTGVSITATATDTTAPNNVTNLATSSVTATSLTLSWTASTSTDVASYDVYNGATLLGNTTSTTYGVTGLTGNTSYTFYVKAKDQAGNIASGTSVSVTTQVPINVIASDSFNRTGLLAGSSTDSYQGGTAKTWAVSGSGAYSTNGTTAYCSTVAASNHNVAYIDTGYASGSCEILLSTQDLNGSSGPKICFRIQDSENMLVCSFNDTSIDVYSYVGGSSSSNLGTYQVVTKSGDLIKVTTSGTNIKVFLNGTQVISCTDTTTFTSNTKWGFTAYKQPNARIDNFVFSV
jgi:chitodextrinase